jgi:hypothetical protein
VVVEEAMKPLLIAVVIVAWTAAWFWTAGATFAYDQAEFPNLRSYRDCRDAQSFALAWSVVPLSWIMAVPFTDFYMDGWKFPRCGENPVGKP